MAFRGAGRLAYAFEYLLFTAAFTALVVSTFLHREHWMPLLFPAVKHVQLQGQFIRIDRFEVEWLVQDNIGKHFFDTDLNRLKHSLEEIPWVRHAHVVRLWPQTLQVWLEEHDAAARWGMDALISSRGVVFTPARINASNLPVLYASPGFESVALERYRTAQKLFSDDTVVRGGGRNEEGLWSLVLDSGVLVKLGNKHWRSRLDRFAGAWRSGLSMQEDRIRCVDLRYSGGFTVVWKENSESCR